MICAVSRACLKIVEDAAGSGACTEQQAWAMTPNELIRCVRAYEKAQFRLMQAMDMLAWLTGQYCALATNAPQRYPSRPDRVRRRAVGDADMQDMMRRMALRSNGGGA